MILINPPIASDAQVLYPTGVRFLGKGIGLPGGMTPEGFDEAIPRVLPAAQELAKQGAKVISVFGSSLTFYKGAKFHDELIRQVSKVTGRPATTQSNGLLDGLRAVNARRIAVATAYTDVVTERLKIFLQENGFEVTSTKGLGLAGSIIPDEAATHDILFKLGTDAYASSKKADALVVSCGAFKTLDLIVPLENQIKVPVVSSTPHGLMNGVRLLGVSPRVAFSIAAADAALSADRRGLHEVLFPRLHEGFEDHKAVDVAEHQGGQAICSALVAHDLIAAISKVLLDSGVIGGRLWIFPSELVSRSHSATPISARPFRLLGRVLMKRIRRWQCVYIRHCSIPGGKPPN